MTLPLRSRFVYGDTGDFTTSLPSRPWIPVDETIGGGDVSASGVPATYIVRRDVLLELPIRIEEGEWAALLALIAFGQSGQTIEWYPDADAGTNYDVYLQAPAPGGRFAPTRDSAYPHMLELTLTLRGAGSTPWLPYFAE